MRESGDQFLGRRLRRGTAYRFRPAAIILIPVAAILLQVYLPLFFSGFAQLELPLLVTVYFAIKRRQPVSALLIGAGIGLVQDALSNNPIGMFGIIKTLTGYFAGVLSTRMDTDSAVVRFFINLFFYFFHQFFYWAMSTSMLGHQPLMEPLSLALYGLVNAIVAVPLFRLLDKI
jgi:rod shape-determining protein MreD